MQKNKKKRKLKRALLRCVREVMRNCELLGFGTSATASCPSRSSRARDARVTPVSRNPANGRRGAVTAAPPTLL